jgi:hypothetical protein
MIALPPAQRPLLSVAQGFYPLTQLLSPYLASNFAHVPAFIAFFFNIFVSAVVLWRFIGSASHKQAPRLASFVVSTVHSVICCFAAWPELAAWMPSLALDATNTEMQALIAQYCLAFMVFDLTYMIAFEPGDYLMIGHHVLAGLYNVVALRLGVGAISAILPFFMGEFATPLYNAFNVTKELKGSRPWAQATFPWASTAFTTAFVMTRCIIAPPVMAWFVYAMFFTSPGIPRPWAVFMGTAVSIGMAGSQIWAWKLVKGWRKMRRQRRASRKSSGTDGAKKDD